MIMTNGHLTRVSSKLRERAKEIGIPDLIFGFAVGVIILYGALIIHELFHVFFAWLFGYPAGIGALLMFEGWTVVAKEIVNPQAKAIIALAGPLGSFFVGMYFWKQGKHSIERYLALVLWLISTAPNLLPLADGRDATYIIQGFGYPFAWFIFLVTFGYMWAKLLEEGIGPLRW